MSEVEKPVVHERAYDEYVIDSDYHLHVPSEKLYEYVEDRALREKMERWGPPPKGDGPNTMKTSYATEIERSGLHDRTHGVAINRDEIVESARELGIDVAIVEPGTHLPFEQAGNYPELATALAKAYNDYVLDRVVDVDRGVWATLMVPHWDVEAGLAELDRLGDEPGFVAAQNYFTGEKLWGHTDFDPLLEKITDLDLPLFLHVAGGSAPHSESWRTFTELIVGGLGYNLVANVVNMVMTGVFDKYPELDVAFQEAGTNWLPYVAYRADEQYQTSPEDLALQERMRELDQEYLQRMPSEYMFDNLHVATQPITLPNMDRQRDVEAMLTACRAGETFMYSSDWPHVTVDPANWLFDDPSIDDELRAKILHETTEEVVRLPN